MSGFYHEALLYRGAADYVKQLSACVNSALAAGQPVAVALPEPSLRQLRSALEDTGGPADGPLFVEMSDIGRNPGRIIPEFLLPFADEHAGSRPFMIGEPIWPGRPEVEYAAAVEHEALINLAFADTNVSFVCPYDARRLSRKALSDAEQTHPVVAEYGSRRPGFGYTDAATAAAAFNRPLPEPAGPVAELRFDAGRLRGVRGFVREYADSIRLQPERIDELCVAVNEVATNTVVHSAGPGALRCWRTEDMVCCEVRDQGVVRDPLFGRRRAALDAERGRGLLLAHQLCDLVETHTRPDGTVIRLSVRFGG